MKMFRASVVLGVIVAAAVAPVVYSAESNVKTKVKQILLTENVFGGCMIRPTTSLTAAGLDCKNTWISLDCEGVSGGSKAHSQRMLDAATLAKVTRGDIIFRVTDAVKINGWCMATRAQPL